MSKTEFDVDGNHLISTIQEAVKTEVLDVEPGDYTSRPVYRVGEQPLAAPLEVASLTGLIEYINNGIDGDARGDLFVAVESPNLVRVYGLLDHIEGRRFVPIAAKADTPDLSFDRYIRKEDFTTILQSRFVENDEQEVLLRRLGTLVASEEVGQEDDGVSQRVTMQVGIKRTEETIDNPVMLRPFRTFTEVDQPASPFIVRIKKDDVNGILVGLFEADGGAWRNAARRSIQEYIADGISDAIPVLA